MQFLAEGRFLQIEAVAVPDGGEYSCTVSNHLGTTSLRFQVEIHGEQSTGSAWAPAHSW